MVALEKKAVVSADAAAWHRVEELVRQGRYATPSHSVREAVAEKLARLDEASLDLAVARYVETYTLFKTDLAALCGALTAEQVDAVDRAIGLALGLTL